MYHSKFYQFGSLNKVVQVGPFPLGNIIVTNNKFESLVFCN